MKFKNFILDVDGVFTDGKFHYSSEGKIMKVFGDADSDALSLIKEKINIEMVSADKRGFSISSKRIHDDMGYKLSLISSSCRLKWISQNFILDETIYMGDGLFDSLIFNKVGFSIAPANAFYKTLIKANYVTKARGGEGAVAEAVVYIVEELMCESFEFYLLSHITD
jgi:3-deoxy-D-manno-octulosonate 8-phosphate phosphatase (KDO 8-P phosphatase)